MKQVQGTELIPPHSFSQVVLCWHDIQASPGQEAKTMEEGKEGGKKRTSKRWGDPMLLNIKTARSAKTSGINIGQSKRGKVGLR